MRVRADNQEGALDLINLCRHLEDAGARAVAARLLHAGPPAEASLSDVLHGIAQRAADGTAAANDAVETGRKAAPLAELAWDCALRHQAATR